MRRLVSASGMVFPGGETEKKLDDGCRSDPLGLIPFGVEAPSGHFEQFVESVDSYIPI